MISTDKCVQEKLNMVNPGDILALFMKLKIDFLFLALRDGQHYGTLARCGKIWVIIIRKRTNKEENWKTLLHELFHLFLFDQGVDSPDNNQEFNDSTTEASTDIFMEKYPNFTENLWRYIHERPKFHL